MFPTAMTFGTDGAIYISDFGNESNFGEGVILRVVPGDSAVVAPAVPLPQRARHLRHPEVERDPRPGRERRGRGEGRHRRAEGGAQVGLLARA